MSVVKSVGEDGRLLLADERPTVPQMTESELRAWAFISIKQVLDEHPNEDDRAAALLGLGILMAGRR